MRGDRVASFQDSWDFHRYIAGDGDDGCKPATWRYRDGPHVTHVNDPHIVVDGVRLLTVVCDTCVDVWWTSVPESEVDKKGQAHRSHMARLGRVA